MSKPPLTAERLKEGGFEEVGCWTLCDQGSLGHAIDLPKRAGVYAFAIDGVVQYVGLASKSLAQRLNFYRKPGVSQATNIRLNGTIRDALRTGATVQILIASPPDQSWNGFTIKAAEGLEAGIIAEFEVPWNIRGATALREPRGKVSQEPSRQSGVAARVLELIRRRPGMTELEIAQAIYGPSAQQPQLNPICRKLVAERLVERRGRGHSDPFIYYPLAGQHR